MNKYHYLYSITYYEGICGDITVEHGLLQAHSLPEATELICEYYGEENVEKLDISVFDVPMFTFDDEGFELIKTILNK